MNSRDRLSWRQYELEAVQNAGQVEKALALRKQLARDFPHDAELQCAYAEALIGAGIRRSRKVARRCACPRLTMGLL